MARIGTTGGRLRRLSRAAECRAVPAAFDPRELGAIFAGGCVGALARAGLAEAAGDGSSGAWPWPTFVVNVLGALLLGIFVARLPERPPGYARPLLTTGFCGALTTFSTVQIELLRMLDHDHVVLFLGYGSASVAAGLAAVTLATSATRRGG
jgi:CrcB protein